MNPMSLAKKNIIITGAASGIGRETALLVSKLGARVVLIDVNEAGIENVAKECVGETQILVGDVSDDLLIKEKLTEIKKEWGKFHGLVHCAGVASVLPLKSLSLEQYDKVQTINTKAGLGLAKIFSDKRMFEFGQNCSIVFISSVYGVVGSACNVAYAASKAAIIGITKALAVELAAKKIRVNCVAPGFVKTAMAGETESKFDETHEEVVEKMHLLGWGEPIDIANAIAFLLSDASKWTTGAVFNIDGGYTAQ